MNQFEQSFSNPNNPMTTFSHLSSLFLESFIPLASKSRGLKIPQHDFVQLIMKLPSPLGLNADQEYEAYL